ncbi:MAG: ribonuclease [Ruminiclostridium sp.]|nr:ribonuclease [Ruminiclostridium sp.]
MKKKLSSLLLTLLSLFMVFTMAACGADDLSATMVTTDSNAGVTELDPNGSYTTKEDVALYIHLYGCLPENFMTKDEARDLGWEGGSLEPYAPGMCIGGDYFGNYEGLLPEDRDYTECDIDTLGADSRGPKRIVFSDDGLIYYTPDHYESFELLYGEE